MLEQKRPFSPLTIVLMLSGGFFIFFLLVSGIFFLKRSPTEKGEYSSFFESDGVGVIEVNGVILDSKKTLMKLEKYEDDSRIKAVVLRLNSPGGAVAPSQEIYEAVREYKKPLVVSMGSMAASGAYYIACGSKKIFANPGTITGSIGVVMEFANLEKLYNWAKVQRYSIKTGKFKDAGAEYRPMTAEEKALFQNMVDDVLVQFKKAVATGRNLSMEKVSTIADGRIFSGSQAYSLHLVDQLGTLKDAVQEAANLANIKGKPRVIYYERQKRKWLDIFMDDSSSESSAASRISGGSLENLISLFRSITQGVGSDSEGVREFVPGIYWIWSGVK